MKKLTLIFAFLTLVISYAVNAQHSISGTFTPASKYTWLIAYKLNLGAQNYIADTSIKNGTFNLTIPENAPTGMYRLVYALPQEKFYFDVIYNGKEDIKLTFNTNSGVQFIASEENKLYNSHTKAIDSIEHKILDFYLSDETSKKTFSNLSKELITTQKQYEKKSEGLIAHDLITANTLPVPLKYVPFQEYIAFKKENYFKSVDMKNPVLLSSNFLTQKMLDYVFKELPLDTLSQEETEKAITDNVKFATSLIKENAASFRLSVLFNIWSKAAESNFNVVSDFINNSYLKELTKKTGNKKMIHQIAIHNRLRLGAISPEIYWKEGENEKMLSNLTNAENYVLVFWSSTCSHCLRELPPLHKELKKNSKITTIAVGLENDTTTWKKESAKLSNFKHAIALGKWKSDYAKLFDIHATPSYFILDKNKRIIAKPENDKVLIEFLNKE